MNMRNLALLGVVLFLLIALVTVMTTSSTGKRTEPVSYSEFMRMVDSKQIREVTLDNQKMTATVGDRQVQTNRDQLTFDLADKLTQKGAIVTNKPSDSGGTILSYVFSALPLLFIVG